MFWNRKNICPISNEDKEFINKSFDFLQNSFGSSILNNDIILPNRAYFDIHFGEKEGAFSVMEIVAKQMGVELKNIFLEFYREEKPLDFSGGLTSVQDESSESTTGKYVQYENGEVEILIEESQLSNPISLIATFAHELAHYKLLYELQMNEVDEFLTDILTIVYGFGIFTANTSITKMQTWSNHEGSGWQVQGGSGYLHFKVCGYALAYFALLKNDEDPSWLEFLEKDVLKEFKKSMKYLKNL